MSEHKFCRFVYCRDARAAFESALLRDFVARAKAKMEALREPHDEMCAEYNCDACAHNAALDRALTALAELEEGTR